MVLEIRIAVTLAGIVIIGRGLEGAFEGANYTFTIPFITELQKLFVHFLYIFYCLIKSSKSKTSDTCVNTEIFKI